MALTKEARRERIKKRIRKVVTGDTQSPRLSVFRSNKQIYAQLIDDSTGKTIVAEFVPVTDFREAKCRKYTEGHCDRGGYCNFLHPKFVMREQKKTMFKWMYDEYP
jgi:ribosomal protein L18